MVCSSGFFKRTPFKFILPILFFAVVDVESATIVHDGTINSNTTWGAADDHVVNTTVSVANGVSLTIEPGTLVKFKPGTGLLVDGVLVAGGTSSDKITFTSYSDDSVGGDTNGDGVSYGQKGSWYGIRFSDSVIDALTRLEHANISYAGQSYIRISSAVYARNAAPTLANLQISKTLGHGIHLNGAQGGTGIQNVSIRSCTDAGVYYSGSDLTLSDSDISQCDYGVRVYTGTPQIANNTIENNSLWGIYFERSQTNVPVISNNLVVNNGRGVYLPLSALPNSTDGNTLTPNDMRGVWAYGGSLGTDLTLSVLGSGVNQTNTYVFSSDLTTQTGTNFTVQPGVITKFASSAGLTVNGSITAVGTVQNRITFTSDKDDNTGGDVAGDGLNWATAGSWDGIELKTTATGSLVYVDIQYGGGNSRTDANLVIRGNNVSVTNSKISQSAERGLRIYGDNADLSGLEIYGNLEAAISVETGGSAVVTNSRLFANSGDAIYVNNNAGATVTDSEMFGNAGHGINTHASSLTVNAQDNWWGAADGPSGQGPGTGDSIQGNVDITSLLIDDYRTTGTKFSYLDAGGSTVRGSLPAPTVIQGQSTSDWGSEPQHDSLYDVNRVVLDYIGLNAQDRYDIFVTYINGDNTVSVGGTYQQITDANERSLLASQKISTTSPTVHRAPVSPDSYAGGDLRLNIVRDRGLRSSIAQLWLVEKTTSDLLAPSAAISQPLVDQHLSGSNYVILGTSSGNASRIEIGIDSGAGIEWFVVSSLQNDGGWSYVWSMQEEGIYQLYARAKDNEGNTQALGAPLVVTVNQNGPAPVVQFYGVDTAQDNGGSVTLGWGPSSDDGAGANDVASYEINRRASGTFAYNSLTSVAVGVTTYDDPTALTGSPYDYQIIVIDQGGNRSVPVEVFGIKAIDNSVADATAPEDVTGLIGAVGNGFVHLTWSASADTAQDLVDQRFDISSDGGATWGTNAPDFNNLQTLSLGAAATSHLVTGLVNSGAYRFRVRTQDGASPANMSSGVQTGSLIPLTTAYTQVSGSISQDTVWELGTYYVSSNLTINSNASLTIRPGVVVKFGQNVNFIVSGPLNANGAVFTSWADDSFGGDTNGDGPSNGVAGSWNTININSGGSGSSLVDNTIRYATTGITLSSGSDYAVEGNTIEYGSTYGISQSAQNTHIASNILRFNGGAGIYYGNGSATIVGNQSIDNMHGLWVYNGTPVAIEGNTFSNNTEQGIYFRTGAAVPPLKNNTIANNGMVPRLSFSALPSPEDGNNLSGHTHIDVVGGTRSTNLVLDPSLSPVFYIAGDITINSGVLVNIAPGTIFKFASSAGITNNGALFAQGTSGNRIVMTSYRDDSVGGDTNGDGPSVGEKSDWDGVTFNSTTIDFASSLKYVDINYAGASNGQALSIANASPSIADVRILNANNRALNLSSSSSVIERIEIDGCSGEGIYIQSGQAVIRDSVIRNCQYGIRVHTGSPLLTGNTIEGNSDWGIYFTSNQVSTPVITNNQVVNNGRGVYLPVSAVPSSSDGNTLTPNMTKGVWIHGSTRSTDLTLGIQGTGPDQLNSYVISGDLTMQAGTSLTIEPGVITKFMSGASLAVNGAINALGSVQNRITFTSVSDDLSGGDINGDGRETAPFAGSWDGLELKSTATGNLAYVDIRYGGYVGGNQDANLVIRSDNTSVSQARISQSSTYGVRVYGDDVNLSNSDIYGNEDGGIYIHNSSSAVVTNSRLFANAGDAIYVNSSAGATVTESELFGNTVHGINTHPSSLTVDAQDNWWGAADGPGGDGPGTGDSIQGNVDITSLLMDNFRNDGTEFSYLDAGGTVIKGSLAAPTVSQGQSTSDWGSTPQLDSLYDVNRVVLDYAGLNTQERYDIFVTYFNGDDTGSVGGTYQQITDANEQSVLPSQEVTDAAPTVYRAPVLPSAYSDGNLRLNIIRDQGLRSSVAQVWLVEKATTDTVAPTAAITQPTASQHLSGVSYLIQGTSSGDASLIEIGIDSGAGIEWFTASSMLADGSWSYVWNFSGEGSYQVQVKATDEVGNSQLSTLVSVVVNQSAPASAFQLYGVDTAQDNGSSITLGWALSSDDGGGANDVATYELFRRVAGTADYSLLTQVAAGVAAHADSPVSTGTLYDYQVVVVDLAGNRSASAEVLGVKAIDNSVADTTAPEEVTGLNGTVGNGFVHLTWLSSANSDNDLVDQRLDISSDGGATWGTNAPAFNNLQTLSLGAAATSHLMSELVNGNEYRFRIRTQDGASPANLSSGTQTGLLTPLATAYTQVSGSISTDTVWELGTYYVSSNVTISSGNSLTINPGVVVKFAPGTSIIANGPLDATNAVFTSWADDTFGGDTNGNGPSSGAAGNWSAININSGGSGSRLINNTIRYATTGVNLSSGSDIRVEGNTIEYVNGNGIDLNASSTYIAGNTLRFNRDVGIYYRSGSSDIVNNQVTNNGSGFWVYSGTPLSIDGNNFSDNTGPGIHFRAAANAPPIRNNTIANNGQVPRLPFSALPSPEDGNTLSGHTHIEVLNNTRTENLTLSPALAPVLHVIGDISVGSGVLVNILPGTIFKFATSAGISNGGALFAQGTLDNRIVMTSHRDDSVGGDTNGDGPSSAAPGDWDGVTYTSTTIDFASGMKFVDIQYAGQGSSAQSLYLNNANPVIEDVRILQSGDRALRLASSSVIERLFVDTCGDYGVYITSGEATIRNSEIRNCEQGIYVQAGSPLLANNTIEDNALWGIYFSSNQANTPVITNNRIVNNGRSVYLPVSAVPAANDGNTLTPNSVNGIWVRGGTRSTDMVLGVQGTGPDQLNSYIISGDLTMQTGTSLTVESGVTTKFAVGASLIVNGSINAVGTAQNRITFTSELDDRAGGDSNNDGRATTPYAGYWKGIDLKSTAAGRLEYVDIRYGGNSSTPFDANLAIRSNNFSINQARISQSATRGLRIYGDDADLTNLDIFGNATGITIPNGGSATISNSRLFANSGDAIYVNSNGGATITGSELFGNSGYAISTHASSLAVNAQGNWWGAIDGPGGDGLGTGDAISGNVDITSLLVDDFLTEGTEYSYFNAGGNNHKHYGLLNPVVSGSASTSMGTSDAQSVLEDLAAKAINVQYNGLASNASYKLLVTYLDGSDESSSQKAIATQGVSIHEEIHLPQTTPTLYASTIPADVIDQGTLNFDIQAIEGYRAKVSSVTLIKEPLLDASVPTINVTAPVQNANLGAGTHVVVGQVVTTQNIDALTLEIEQVGAQTSSYPVSTISTTGEWRYSWTPESSGTYRLSASALTASGIRNTSSLVTVTVDITGIDSAKNLTAISNVDGIDLVWQLSASDSSIQNYKILRSISLLGEFAEVGSVASGINNYKDTTAVVGISYYYRVLAIDASANSAESNTAGPVTLATGPDTSAPEDVTNLDVEFTTFSGSSIASFLTWLPSANSEGDLIGYRIQVSSDNGVTWGTNALVYNNSASFDADINTSRLRIEGFNVASHYRFKVTSVDNKGNESSGAIVNSTPTGGPDQVVTLSGSLTENMVLGAGVYRISGDITIPSNVSLTLTPGVVFKFSSASADIIVNGTLNSNGAIFTSWSDDEYGGDNNGNGLSAGQPGQWGEITLNSTENSSLSNNILRFGGYSNSYLLNIKKGHQLNIENNRFEFSGNGAIKHTTATETRIIGNTIADNNGASDHALSISSGSLFIENNIIERNAWGIYMSGGVPLSISGNTITHSDNYGIHFTKALNAPVVIGNTITNNGSALRVDFSALPNVSHGNIIHSNGSDQIEFYSNARRSNLTLTKDYHYYQVGSSMDAVVALESTVTVQPGVVWKFGSGVGLKVEGVLNAQGTLEEPITFTASNDDSIAGDSNKDGMTSVAQNGHWRGIRFEPSPVGSSNILDYAVIRFAGNSNDAAVYIDESEVTVTNSEISNSSLDGIRIYDASPVISGNMIWGNEGAGINAVRNSNSVISYNSLSWNGGAGIENQSASNVIAASNLFVLNKGLGLTNSTTNAIDATQSWWGDTDGSGPYHPTTNASGTGGEVSNNVTYAPFVNLAQLEYSYTNFEAAGAAHKGNLPAPTLVQGNLSDEWDSANKSPSKTMVWHADEVVLDYSGLNIAKKYRLRVTYFNSDSSTMVQSIQDGNSNLVASSQLVPSADPVQYEFEIPQAYYATGAIQLRFINDNPATSIRATVSDVWIIEDKGELIPPRFDSVEYNDVDGDGIYSLGDELHFHFTESLDTSLVQGATDANLRLPTDTSAIYGNLNQVAWSADQKTVVVTLTDGFTVSGGEIVTPSISDTAGNPAVDSQQLPIIDTIQPQLITIEWQDTDTTTNLTLGDKYRFVFSEALDTSILVDGSNTANAQLRPEGGKHYGTANTIEWESGNQAVLVTVTNGFTIIGEERVIPGVFITDVAGNSIVTNSDLVLQGRDLTAPQLLSVEFDDKDGSGSVSLGDNYTFVFNEPLQAAAIANGSTDANVNLSPEARIYGSTNNVVWSDNNRRVMVEITEDFTVIGNELVTPSNQLIDLAQNSVVGNLNLNTLDIIAPEILNVSGSAQSPVPVSANYQVVVQYSSSMDISVTPQIVVTGSAAVPTVPVSGTWSTTVYPNDTYSSNAFALSQAMVGDLLVTATLGSDLAGNQAGNSGNYIFAVQAPAPGITSHPIAPATTNVNTTSVIVTGSRQANTSIWVGANEIVALGSGDWNAQINLTEGQNDIALYAKDGSGNASAAAELSFFVDSVAPSIINSAPADGEISKDASQIIIVNMTEAGTGINMSASSLSVARNGFEFTGNWTLGVNAVAFTPNIQITEGNYTIAVTLVDNAGNTSALFNAGFSVDQTPPAAPVVNTTPSVTTTNPLTITGSKEAGTSIWLNGGEVAGISNLTSWSFDAPLTAGSNALAITAVDGAGNISVAANVNVSFDNTAPGFVSPTADGVLDGTSVSLDWSSYDEMANGNDIANYRVYISTMSFTDIASANLIDTVQAGVKNYTANGLVRNQTYYFAVVAVDTLNNFQTNVTSVSVFTSDTTAPANVTNLSVVSAETSLTASWVIPVTETDIADVVVTANNNIVQLPGTTTQYEVTGLSAATAYDIKVELVDSGSNKNSGETITGVTLLANPVIATTEALNNMVELSWNAIAPAEHVANYAIYASTTDFTSVNGMTPKLVVAGSTTTTKVAGLSNSTTYYFAVTTINTSGGEQNVVTTSQETPSPDTQGPEVSSVLFGGSVITDGAAITENGVISATVIDSTGIGRVEFYINDQLLTIDANDIDGYNADWSIAEIADGPYTIKVSAYDTLENKTDKTVAVNVALTAPSVPVINSPEPGFITNESMVTVSGVAETSVDVLIYKDATQVAGPIVVGTDGSFEAQVVIVEGTNLITATAQNRGGSSAQSVAVSVVRDTSLPPKPGTLTASSGEAGDVVLNWSSPAFNNFTGYNLYRSSTPFTDAGLASKVNSTPITANTYKDIPMVDGVYYYAVESVNELTTPSELSNVVNITSDSTPPQALSIQYSSRGNVDPTTGAMATGYVDVIVTVSEELLTIPFMSVAPDGGTPISIKLIQVQNFDSELQQYEGQFEITDRMTSGPAYAVFSARDQVGNRGTEILEGGQIIIDAQGPNVGTLTLAPTHPIKNDQANPQTVSVDITLTEASAAASEPNLSYLLSAVGRTSTSVTLVQTGELTWRGSFTLEADAGLLEPELLSFSFSAEDELGNLGNKILSDYQFQVYQGDLPPLSYPFGLSAEVQPGGQVKLSWLSVDEADDYQIFRKGPSDLELLPVGYSSGALTYTDQTVEDGEHQYAVATVRQRNGQDSLSATSPPVLANAISALPLAPTNLNLQLIGRGVLVGWEPSATAGDITYKLYRSDAAQILSIEGLTPIIDNIGSVQALDTRPSQNEHTYTVTSVDVAGNESEPSASFYLNFELLPVKNVSIIKTGIELPVVSWEHSSASVVAYDIYLGDKATGVKLNSEPLVSAQFTDQGYDGNEREFTIVPIDNGSVEGPERSVVLPNITATLKAGSEIARGIMNRLEYTVENTGTKDVSGVHLRSKYLTYDHVSEVFSISAGETKVIEVVVGGYDELLDTVSLETAIDIQPVDGEQVRIIRSEDIPVVNAGLALALTTKDFTRGGTGQLKFTLENSSAVDIELISALNNGQKDSDEIRFLLQDADGNVIATQNLRRFTDTPNSGGQVISLPNHTTVIRIPAAATYNSGWIDVAVPGTVPSNLTVSMEVDKLHYRYGQAEQVDIGGISTNIAAIVSDTPYVADVTNITPAVSFGDQDIVITGRAFEKEGGTAFASADVNLVIASNGFERSAAVIADELGNFTYTFTPLPEESGIFNVSAIHPDILDRPEQSSFTISRVVFKPGKFNLRIPYNYAFGVPIKLTAGEGTTSTNTRLVFEAATQDGGVLPTGINVVPGNPVTLVSGQTETIELTVTGDDTASSIGSFKVAIRSDEGGATDLGIIEVSYELSNAEPLLFYTPNFVETGVTQQSSVNETVTFENRGFADMLNVQVELVAEDGSQPPAWAYLATTGSLGSLPVGQTAEVTVTINPAASVTDNVYAFKLRVTSDNAPTQYVNVYATVTQSGIGNALFKIADIYTATLDEGGLPILGLEGAKIRLQNEYAYTVEETSYTDANGEALFSNVPAGVYRYRISAPNHTEKVGRIRVNPGVTVPQEVFLDYQLVSVEWHVREITIEDRYEIVLNATFETDVPAAVVVTDPLVVNLPEMQPGDIFYGEFHLTNHGLVRADEFEFSMPADDAYFKYEVMGGIPNSIEAKSRITIPYRIISIAPIDSDGASTGSCSGHSANTTFSHTFKCANGGTSGGGGGNQLNSGGGGGSCGGGSVSTSYGSGGGGGSISGGGGGGPSGGGSGGGGWTECRPYMNGGRC